VGWVLEIWRVLIKPFLLNSVGGSSTTGFPPCKDFSGQIFPNGSFLTASVGRRPSYVWKSLCSARELLTTGTYNGVWEMERKSDMEGQLDTWYSLLHLYCQIVGLMKSHGGSSY
jgi:hypothetical protein